VKKFDNHALKTLGLIQGFSNRQSGNLKVRKKIDSNKNLDKFLSQMGISQGSLVMMEQVHGNKIKVVGNGDKGKVIKGMDGLITNKKGVFLGVNAADCLPLFFYDPKKKNAGIAHAGWKGILLKIVPKMVEEMKKMGSDPGDIIVGVGPHIGACCYLVGEDLVKKFRKEFGDLAKMVYQDKKEIRLDLTVPVIVQLIKSGIKRENIKAPLACTSCQNNKFFSFRKDSSKTYGEMLGVIGWI
jgi:YfiH family protein